MQHSSKRSKNKKLHRKRHFHTPQKRLLCKKNIFKKKHYLYKNESKKQYINYVIYKLNIYEKRD